MTQPKSVFSVYSRLALNHCQFLMLLASFRFDWPQQVKAFLSFFESVTDAPRELFSLDCLLSHISPLPGFYNFFLIQWSLPLLSAGALALFWAVYLRW